MGNSIWKEHGHSKNEYEYLDVIDKVENIFENLNNVKGLQYREGQYEMALDIMDAIKNKEVLLVEAGVGIGKSYAYLIPILQSMKDVESFKGFIISTSTKALQEQLLDDVKSVSDMLGIKINVEVIKGKNNYICKRRLKYFLDKLDNDNRKLYEYILKQVENDVFEKKDYNELREDEWKNINVTYCNEEKCTECYNCPYVLKKNKVLNSNMAICNHDLLIENLRRYNEDRIMKNPSVIVLDEAHTLEEKIRNSSKCSLKKCEIEYDIIKMINRITTLRDTDSFKTEIITLLNECYQDLSNLSKDEIDKLKREEVDYSDFNRVNMIINSDIKRKIQEFISLLNNLKNNIEVHEKRFGIDNCESKHNISEYIKIFSDMIKDNIQDFTYWIEFIDSNKINIVYVPKDITRIGSYIFGDSSVTKVFTSATLTIDGDYDYFKESIGLNKIVGQNVYTCEVKKSPFDYNENMMIYQCNSISNPKDRNNYIEDITNEIFKLITITHGKSLILFTSKRDMRLVYDKIRNKGKFDFDILIQDDNDADKLKNRFSSDINSCLFATGTFWEGINIKGKSLSSVIIPKLPFPIVDPIINQKALKYSDGFREIYMPEMLIKLQQGMGRLIRSELDTGIIALLDSRIDNYNKKYDNIIKSTYLSNNVSSDIDEVQNFVKKKVL